MSKLLENLVAWLPREIIRDDLPEPFINTENNKCQVILDCAVFIERTKPLDCQVATWSDYKRYNTKTVSCFFTLRLYYIFKFMLWWPSK